MLIHMACDNDIHPPLFGATQRLFGLARGMAQQARVRALCVVPNRSRGLRAELVAGVELRRVRSWHTSVAWWLERARLAPPFTAEAGHRTQAARYRREFGEQGDVLLCDLALTGLFPGAGSALRVYHAQNVEAQRWETSAPHAFRHAGWRRQLAALERRAVQESDLSVACTEEDAEQLRRLHGARAVEVVANGYDETALAAPSELARRSARAVLGIPEQAYVAAFVGGDWAPNHEALEWLVREVGPRLAGDGIMLLAVGAVARRYEHLREPWLVARSEVPDLATVLAAADAGLNPVIRGGGSNVKVPTYLALGLAVVSSPFGLRGFAPLAPNVTSTELGGMADVLRARPRGWAARGESAPDALGAYAWGTLGARLVSTLAAHVSARARGAA